MITSNLLYSTKPFPYSMLSTFLYFTSPSHDFQIRTSCDLYQFLFLFFLFQFNWPTQKDLFIRKTIGLYCSLLKASVLKIMDYFNTLNTGDNFTHRKLLLSLWISSLVHTSPHPKKSQQTNDSSSSSLIGSFSNCSIMGVITYDHETTSSIPLAKMFKAFILDSDKLIPKILPQAIKSTEIIEGDGGPGSIKKITFREG